LTEIVGLLRVEGIDFVTNTISNSAGGKFELLPAFLFHCYMVSIIFISLIVSS